MRLHDVVTAAATVVKVPESGLLHPTLSYDRANRLIGYCNIGVANLHTSLALAVRNGGGTRAGRFAATRGRTQQTVYLEGWRLTGLGKEYAGYDSIHDQADSASRYLQDDTPPRDDRLVHEGPRHQRQLPVSRRGMDFK
jgi:hypothetical protein